MNKYLSFFFILFGLGQLSAQYDHQEVLKDLEGDELFDAIIENFKPENVLAFGPARDTLFALIDSKNNVLECVYTGHTVILDPNEDPTISAFQDGSSEGINTEHTFPQSKGASEGNARSDMHHLFPTRSPVNSARSNKPFQDIPDTETNNWYYLADAMSTIPTSDIDSYSEDGSNAFEPRESHKGNVARAMFYFYTMYRDEANTASATYFESQRETLCRWHWQDPVDEVEWNRNKLIAVYQSGKDNPIVLDCSVAARLYCPEIDNACALVDTEEIIIASPKVFPNPSNNQYQIDWLDKYNILLSDSQGNILMNADVNGNTTIDVPSLPGIYYLHLNNGNGVGHTMKLVKL